LEACWGRRDRKAADQVRATWLMLRSPGWTRLSDRRVPSNVLGAKRAVSRKTIACEVVRSIGCRVGRSPLVACRLGDSSDDRPRSTRQVGELPPALADHEALNGTGIVPNWAFRAGLNWPARAGGTRGPDVIEHWLAWRQGRRNLGATGSEKCQVGKRRFGTIPASQV
jgi:hypothetical protein